MKQIAEMNKLIGEQAPITLALSANGLEQSRTGSELRRKGKRTQNKVASIKVRLLGTHRKKMQKLADVESVSLSQVVRWAIIKYLERNCPGR